MGRPPTDRPLFAAFFLSGAAGLGNEIVWTRLLSAGLGNEMLGVLGVLAGFFGGMALGAAALHRRVRHAKAPLRIFAGLEIAVAAYAAAAPFLLLFVAARLPAVLGPAAGDRATVGALALHVLVAGTVLLPATFAMGASFPALVEARRRTADDDDGRGVARLYGANTVGAVAGTLASVHLLLPALGMAGAALACAGLGAASAAVALKVHRDGCIPEAPSPPTPRTLDLSKDPDDGLLEEPWVLLVAALVTGACGVGLETVLVRVLGQVFDGTVYTFAAVLAVYLVGTWAGALAYGRCSRRLRGGRPATVLCALLAALALSVPAAAAVTTQAPAMFDALAPDTASALVRSAAEAAVAGAVFLPPTFLMGLCFAHLVGLLPQAGVGRIYAANTLGSAAAPLLFGLWAIESYGYADALYAVAYGYGAAFLFVAYFRRLGTTSKVAGLAAILGAAAAGPHDLVLVKPDEDWEEIDRRETAMGLVMVSQYRPKPGAAPSSPPLRRLQVNRRYRMGGALSFGERRMGHLPLLLHPAPRRALYLGVGTGATMGAVTTYDDLRATGVELVPAVLEMVHYFAEVNGHLASAPNATLVAADARRFVAGASDRFDVVVADLFHPERDGAGSLYAREHFEAVRAHLAPGGLFAQWVPLHQFAWPDLRVLIRTFLDVFPDAVGFLGIYNVQTPALALVGGSVDLDPDRLARRLHRPVYAQLLMSDVRDLLAARFLDTKALAAVAEGAPANTDLWPRILLAAPRRPKHVPRGPDNLRRLLARASPPDAAAIGGPQAALWAEEARTFQRALRLYLEAEFLRTAETDGSVPDGALHLYLSAYEIAPDFAPARGMLLQAARTDPDRAGWVLPLMIERTPDLPRLYQVYGRILARTGHTGELADLMETARRRLGAGAAPKAPIQQPPSP